MYVIAFLSYQAHYSVHGAVQKIACNLCCYFNSPLELGCFAWLLLIYIFSFGSAFQHHGRPPVS